MMITIVGGIVIALFIMIFLYMRGENHRRTAQRLSAQLDGVNRETRYLTEVVIELAKEEQQTLRDRYSKIHRLGSPKVSLMRNTGLLIESCEAVIRDSTLGHKTVQAAFKHYIENHTNHDFEEFNNFILQSSAEFRQLWSKNTLHDYIELCKKCMDELD